MWQTVAQQKPPGDRPVLISINASHHHHPDENRVCKATWTGESFRIYDEYHEHVAEEQTRIDPKVCVWMPLPRPGDPERVRKATARRLIDMGKRSAYEHMNLKLTEAMDQCMQGSAVHDMLVDLRNETEHEWSETIPDAHDTSRTKFIRALYQYVKEQKVDVPPTHLHYSCYIGLHTNGMEMSGECLVVVPEEDVRLVEGRIDLTEDDE